MEAEKESEQNPNELLRALVSRGSSHNLDNMLTQGQRAQNTPNISTNTLQFPREFLAPCLELSANDLNKEKMPTLIIGTLSQGYTTEMFEQDVANVKAYFSQEDNVYPVLLKPVSDALNKVLNSSDAANQMHAVIESMNRNYELGTIEIPRRGVRVHLDGNVARIVSAEERIVISGSPNIRIVSVGVCTSPFIFKALEYFLRSWTATFKHVYFVTTGELPGDHNYINFWRKACIKNNCGKVQYVNLQEYIPFGYYKP